MTTLNTCRLWGERSCQYLPLMCAAGSQGGRQYSYWDSRPEALAAPVFLCGVLVSNRVPAFCDSRRVRRFAKKAEQSPSHIVRETALVESYVCKVLRHRRIAALRYQQASGVGDCSILSIDGSSKRRLAAWSGAKPTATMPQRKPGQNETCQQDHGWFRNLLLRYHKGKLGKVLFVLLR